MKKHVLEPLPRGALAALQRAVDGAEHQRGSLRPEDYAWFDTQVATMRAALAAVKRQNAAVKHAARLAQDAAQADPTPYH
jgi:hypothetical protein